MKPRWINWVLPVVVLAAGAGAYVWFGQRQGAIPAGLAAGNGRIEATEVDVATKLAGRLADVLVQEGDMVARDQVLARMDTRELAAQLRNARAEMQRAEYERRYAAAMIDQRRSELDLMEKDLKRFRQLYADKSVTLQSLQHQQTAQETALAAVAAAEAQYANAAAAIDAAQAKAEEVQAYIDDSQLKAPIDGRVLYRLAEPGEVLGAGGRILTLLNITDVYMSVYLPTREAGQVDVGSEARIVLDARPDLVIPASVSFVAPKAQFTPKDVETRTEREKLMFRVKVKIDPQLLRAHRDKVKTGLPGVAYVRLSADVAWPPALQATLGEAR